MSVVNSNDGSAAAGVRPTLAETTVEPPSHQLEPPKGSGEGTTDAFDLLNNSAQSVPVPEQEDNKSTICVPEIDEHTSANKQEEEAEVQARCSKKCEIEFQVIDEAALVGSPLLQNAELGNCAQRQEIEMKKAKKPRRRGGKARKNRVILENYPIVNKENKGQQYSINEMEALRFDGLEEQRKRWVEVYCGLSPLVREEYDGLVKLCKIRKEDSVPSFDFDPRLKFQKSAELDNQLITSDPSSLPINDEIGYSEECVEDDDDDDDSDEDYSSIQRPAFMVTGEPDFDSGRPLDGLEYLRRVRWEADRVPKVAVAKIKRIKEQSVYMPQIPDIMKCPHNLLPLKQWEDSFLAEFSELRLAFTRHDPQAPKSNTSIKLKEDISGQMLETNTFDRFITLTSTEASCMLETSGDIAERVNPDPAENSSFKVDLPTLSKILKMDSAARTSMLKKRILSVENLSTLLHDDSLWLFALCVAVDCPLDADTSAALRCLLRKCASLRAAKNKVDDEVVILNILVTITGRYFGQLES